MCAFRHITNTSLNFGKGEDDLLPSLEGCKEAGGGGGGEFSSRFAENKTDI